MGNRQVTGWTYCDFDMESIIEVDGKLHPLKLSYKHASNTWNWNTLEKSGLAKSSKQAEADAREAHRINLSEP